MNGRFEHRTVNLSKNNMRLEFPQHLGGSHSIAFSMKTYDSICQTPSVSLSWQIPNESWFTPKKKKNSVRL